MARNAAVTIEQNFVKGLITEAHGLNFPENASQDTYNCVFDVPGKLTRRLGIDLEDDFVEYALAGGLDDRTINEYIWENVAGLGTTTFTVLQLGDTLHFYESDEIGSLSSAKKGFTVDLSIYQTSGAPSPALEFASFAVGNGHLFVVHPYCEPFYVEYEPDDDTISSNQIDLQIRDFAGLEDGLDIDERPPSLTDEHEYNLRNQGWGDDVATDSSGDSEDSVAYWADHRSDYPSNADVWWYFKDGEDEMAHTQLNSVQIGNTAAPRGHFLLNPFYQDRSAASGIPGFDVVTSSYFRPSKTAFFAGRVVYAGTRYKGFASKIYFSQIIEDEDQYGQCYQSNDPTSEVLFDLLPSDGGVIAIPEIGEVVHLHSVQNQLIIFATNGVWAIGGNEGIGFTASDYSVKRLSANPNIKSPRTYVDVGGIPVWWSADDIITVLFDPTTGNVSTKSVTDQTIRSFFADIPISSKYYAKGAYNPRTQQIQWVYRSTAASEFAENFQYDRILNLNIATQAFYPWSISQIEDGPNIAGIVSVIGTGIIRGNETVTDNLGNPVVDGSAVTVTVAALTSVPLSSAFRYVTIYEDGGTHSVTFAQEKDTDYVDWMSYDGTGANFVSYATGGYKVLGNALTEFQSNYITIYSEVEAGSSAYIQGVWDYANTGSGTGKWSVPQQIYKAATGYTYTSRRLKIRGGGKSLQFRITSDDGCPFNIIGWSVFVTGNSQP